MQIKQNDNKQYSKYTYGYNRDHRVDDFMRKCVNFVIRCLFIMAVIQSSGGYDESSIWGCYGLQQGCDVPNIATITSTTVVVSNKRQAPLTPDEVFITNWEPFNFLGSGSTGLTLPSNTIISNFTYGSVKRTIPELSVTVDIQYSLVTNKLTGCWSLPNIIAGPNGAVTVPPQTVNYNFSSYYAKIFSLNQFWYWNGTTAQLDTSTCCECEPYPLLACSASNSQTTSGFFYGFTGVDSTACPAACLTGYTDCKRSWSMQKSLHTYDINLWQQMANTNLWSVAGGSDIFNTTFGNFSIQANTEGITGGVFWWILQNNFYNTTSPYFAFLNNNWYWVGNGTWSVTDITKAPFIKTDGTIMYYNMSAIQSRISASVDNHCAWTEIPSYLGLVYNITNNKKWTDFITPVQSTSVNMVIGMYNIPANQTYTNTVNNSCWYASPNTDPTAVQCNYCAANVSLWVYNSFIIGNRTITGSNLLPFYSKCVTIQQVDIGFNGTFQWCYIQGAIMCVTMSPCANGNFSFCQVPVIMQMSPTAPPLEFLGLTDIPAAGAISGISIGGAIILSILLCLLLVCCFTCCPKCLPACCIGFSGCLTAVFCCKIGDVNDHEDLSYGNGQSANKGFNEASPEHYQDEPNVELDEGNIMKHPLTAHEEEMERLKEIRTRKQGKSKLFDNVN